MGKPPSRYQMYVWHMCYDPISPLLRTWTRSLAECVAFRGGSSDDNRFVLFKVTLWLITSTHFKLQITSKTHVIMPSPRKTGQKVELRFRSLVTFKTTADWKWREVLIWGWSYLTGAAKRTGSHFEAGLSPSVKHTRWAAKLCFINSVWQQAAAERVSVPI